MKYGTREWLESQYAADGDDPWGLDWRQSQQYRYQRMLSTLREVTAPNWVPQRILDAGCATGSFTDSLSVFAPTASVFGIDIAEAAVSRAQIRHPHIEFERMSLAECASKYSRSFDLVTCLEVLYYLPATERAIALRQLSGLLQPGGILLVSSMTANPPYMSLDELTQLVSKELPIVFSGQLYLKPIVLWEKMQMRLSLKRAGEGGGSQLQGCVVNTQKIQSVERWSKRFFGAGAKSHGFVLARRD